MLSPTPTILFSFSLAIFSHSAVIGAEIRTPRSLGSSYSNEKPTIFSPAVLAANPQQSTNTGRKLVSQRKRARTPLSPKRDAKAASRLSERGAPSRSSFAGLKEKIADQQSHGD